MIASQQNPNSQKPHHSNASRFSQLQICRRLQYLENSYRNAVSRRKRDFFETLQLWMTLETIFQKVAAFINQLRRSTISRNPHLSHLLENYFEEFKMIHQR